MSKKITHADKSKVTAASVTLNKVVSGSSKMPLAMPPVALAGGPQGNAGSFNLVASPTTTVTQTAKICPEDLLKATNFTRQEADILCKKFAALTPLNDRIDRSKFRDLLSDVFGLDDSLLMDRVFRTVDSDSDNYVSFEEYMRGMSVFLKGKFDERMKFCFKVYDLNGDRYISKEEMFQMLKNSLVRGTEEDEDGVKDLVELVLKKLDEDRDGRVSEADWANAVTKEHLLLEAFGQCLPTTKTIERYLSPNHLYDDYISISGDKSETALNKLTGGKGSEDNFADPLEQKKSKHSNHLGVMR